MKTGEWPARLHDVEEMEMVLLHQHESADEVLPGLHKNATGDVK
jgi:hypothetical protein